MFSIKKQNKIINRIRFSLKRVSLNEANITNNTSCFNVIQNLKKKKKK